MTLENKKLGTHRNVGAYNFKTLLTNQVIFTVLYLGVPMMSDAQLIEVIKQIVSRGNNAEVRKRKDGTLVVMEVKKNIYAS